MAVSAELQIIISAVNNAKAQITGLVKDLSGVSGGLTKINNTSVTRPVEDLRKLGTEAQKASQSFVSIALKIGLAVEAGRRLLALPETYKVINSQLRIAAKSQDDFNNSQKATTAIALRTGSSLEGVVGLYAKLRNNANLASEDALKLTEIIGQATKLDGGGAGADAAIFQLQQGLSSGTLRGEELNSVLEQTPSLAKAIADGLKTNVGGLRAIAAQGGLTAEVVKNALFAVQGQIKEKFDQLPISTSRAFENIKTSAILEIGKIDSALGITSGIATVLQGIATNIGAIVPIVGALSVAFVGLKVQALIAAGAIGTASGIIAGAVAILTAPITIIVGLFTGLIFIVSKLINDTNSLTETVAQEATALETLSAIISITIGLFKDAISYVGDLYNKFTDLISSTDDTAVAFDNMGRKIESSTTKSSGFVRSFFNTVLDFLPLVGRGIAAFAVAFSQSISQLFKSVANEASALGKDLKNVLSGDFSFSNLAKSKKESFAAFKEIGKQFGTNLKEGFEEFSKGDTIGKAIKRVNKEINDNRKKNAEGKFTGTDGTGTPAVPKKTTGGNSKGLKISDDELKANRALLAQELEDLKARLTQASKLYDEAYASNLISLEDYYAAKQAIADRQSKAEIQLERDTLKALENQKNKIAATATKGKNAVDQELTKKSKIAEIELEIEKSNSKILGLERDRGFAAANISAEYKKAKDYLDEQVATLALANKEQVGLLTTDERLAQSRIRNRELLDKANASNNPAFKREVELKIKLEVDQSEFSGIDEKIGIVRTRLAEQQKSLDIQVATGLLTQEQARKRLIELQATAADQIDASIPRAKELAETLGEKAQLQVAGYKNEVEQLRTVIDDVAVRINGSLKDAAGTAFKDFVSGAKTAGEAFRQFALSVLSDIAKISSEKLLTGLFDSLGAGGESGGIGGFISGLIGGGKKGKDRGDNPSNPLYVKDSTKAVDPSLTDVINDPVKAVTDTFFGSVKEGFGKLVDVGKTVFDKIGSFLSGLFSGGGGGGGGSDISGLITTALSLFGFADGGYVSGAGTGTSDSIVARLSNGEHVTKASQTAKWLPLLTAINSGSLDSMSPFIPTRPHFASGGLVDTAAQSKPTGGTGASSSSQMTRIVNVIDPAMAKDYLTSSAGEKVILNLLSRNKSGIQSILR